MKKIIYTLAILLVFSFSFGIFHTVFGIGQITEPIIIEDVLREQKVTATLKILNSGEEAVYLLETKGDIEEWTKFYEVDDIEFNNPVTEVAVPSGIYLDVIAQFSIPEGTPNGEYSGQVVVATKPADESIEGEGTQTSVNLKVGREVTITVTDKEVIDFVTTVIPEKYDVGRDTPLSIKITYDNKGNISIRPDIHLRITKGAETVFNAIFPYPENEEAVAPQEKKTIPDIVWQTAGQESGKYKAEIGAFVGDKEITKKDFRFNVASGAGGIGSLLAAVLDGNLTLAWLIVGGVLIILAGILYAVFRRKTRSSTSRRKTRSSTSRMSRGRL